MGQGTLAHLRLDRFAPSQSILNLVFALPNLVYLRIRFDLDPGKFLIAFLEALSAGCPLLGTLDLKLTGGHPSSVSDTDAIPPLLPLRQLSHLRITYQFCAIQLDRQNIEDMEKAWPNMKGL